MPSRKPLSIEEIRTEAVHFSAKDRLLDFTPNGEGQSPLILSSSDFFYIKWIEKGAPLSIETFFPVSKSFPAEQKEASLSRFKAALKENREDFCNTDLYLALGFLKYDENTLAPALLIPLEVDPTCRLLQISKRRPLENVLLKRKLENIASLPKATDAVVNGTFNIKLYFEMFEKAVSGKYNWKFTRNGICLTFINSTQVMVMKNFLRMLWKRAEISSRPIFDTLLGESIFPNAESLFEDNSYDSLYKPENHYFLHTLDSKSNEAIIDAQNENAIAYAIQALPGADKAKTAANLVADLIAKDKKVLVISRRAVTMQTFLGALFPKNTPRNLDRDKILAKFCKSRNSFAYYYETVNNPLQPSNTTLSNLLYLYKESESSNSKIPGKLFDETDSLNYSQFMLLRSRLEKIIRLYFEEGGLEVSDTFKDVHKTSVKYEDLHTIQDDLKSFQEATEPLRNMADIFNKTGMYPSGITLDELDEAVSLAKEAFNEKTPDFEKWNLHSNGWDSYQDDIKSLPSAGNKWVSYRRQTSEIYTDTAIDENVLESREILNANINSALKGLSDQYRKAKKHLQTLFKNPKSIASDAALLEGVNNLVTLQENRRAYKDCAVLGNHLLGKDWLFEKSNWAILTLKIRYFLDFRIKFKAHPQFKMLVKILEQWHLVKPAFKELDRLTSGIAETKRILENISMTLELEAPLEKLPIKEWAVMISEWSTKWNKMDTHLQLNALFQEVEKMNCGPIAEFLRQPHFIFKELPQSFTKYWSHSQIQKAIGNCPELQSISPSERLQKSSEFRALQKDLCAANANFIYNKLSSQPNLLKNVGLAHSMELIPRETFDVTLFLDADCTSIAEAMPGMILSNRSIFIGDPHAPFQEQFNDSEFIRSTAFTRSILTGLLRKCVPTKEIGFTSIYADASLVAFANERIYSKKIRMLPSVLKKPVKRTFLKDVTDKIGAIAKAAVNHAEKKRDQSLGIIAFSEDTCKKIASAIQTLPKSPEAAKFLNSITQNSFYIKTPERAIQKYRDVIMVCNDLDSVSGSAGEFKLAVCTTLATKSTYLVVSKADLAQQANSKPSLIWDWIADLKETVNSATTDIRPAESILKHEVADFLREKQQQVEESVSRGRIPIGPVICDTRNPAQYLAVIEDDCTTSTYRESVEDREIIRYELLNKLGWKIINVRLPLWRQSNEEEKKRLLAAIEKEQSQAQVFEAPLEEEEFSDTNLQENVVPYEVTQMNIKGTQHDKPIAELTQSQLIVQLKFYVDHESPIHEDILMRRLLELHHIERTGPIIRRTLNDAIKNALQQNMFTKTGNFFYAAGEQNIILRERSSRPDFERKIDYVSPEELALLSASNQEARELLGLI